MARRHSPRTPRALWEAEGRQRQETALALFQGGMKYNQIAEHMGLTYNQVRGLIVRARERQRAQA